MTKGKRMIKIEYAQDNGRKCQNVHGALEVESQPTSSPAVPKK